MNNPQTKYDYNEDIDILHIYSDKINQGVKGCLSFGEYTVDIGMDNSVVGIELEEASKLLNLSENDLESLDSVRLIVRKVSNLLFIGFVVMKNQKESTFQFSVPSNKVEITVN